MTASPIVISFHKSQSNQRVLRLDNVERSAYHYLMEAMDLRAPNVPPYSDMEEDDDDEEEDDDEVLDEEYDRNPSKSSGDERPTYRRREKSNHRAVGLLCLLVGLILGLGTSRVLERYDSDTSAVTPPWKHASDTTTTTTTAAADGPTFIFLVGIEGTGHHFMQALMKSSPAVTAMRRVGAHIPIASVRRTLLSGLMMPYCADKMDIQSPETLYRNLTSSLREAKELLKTELHVTHVPVNGLQSVAKSDNHELSYPDSKNCNRIKHPNLDMFYKACDDAHVNCAAVYLYRDPYAVVSSNIKRHFNKNVQQGIHLYTMMLQVIYAQLSYVPEKTLACIGLYDDSVPDEERWHPIRNLFGWTDPEAFQAYVTSVYQPHTPMTQEEKDDLVPPQYRYHMRSMVAAHDKVVEHCRAIVRENSQMRRPWH